MISANVWGFARVGTLTTKFNLKHKIMYSLKILFEKRHPNSCKCTVSGWVSYDLDKPETRPPKYGKYFVHRKDGKTHWETWNGSGWAYNGNVITFWMEVFPPCPLTMASGTCKHFQIPTTVDSKPSHTPNR